MNSDWFLHVAELRKFLVALQITTEHFFFDVPSVIFCFSAVPWESAIHTIGFHRGHLQHLCATWINKIRQGVFANAQGAQGET